MWKIHNDSETGSIYDSIAINTLLDNWFNKNLYIKGYCFCVYVLYNSSHHCSNKSHATDIVKLKMINALQDIDNIGNI